MARASTTNGNLVQFTSPDDLTPWLLERAALFYRAPSAGVQAKSELLLWRDMLAAETARQRWTLPELAALAAEHQGVIPATATPVGVGFAAGTMLESFQLDPGQYGVDQEKFTAKLLALGPVADHALVMAIARWFAGKHEHDVAGWAAVGIHVTGANTAA